MIHLRIKFVATQNTKFVITSQGKDILEILLFYLKDITVCYQGLTFSHMSKFDPQNISCNLNLFLISSFGNYFLYRLQAPLDISPPTHKPTQNPLRSCITPGLITGISWYLFTWVFDILGNKLEGDGHKKQIYLRCEVL